jgi:hypothetical protein
MNTILFLALVLTFATGLILILLGRRGRKLNNHPQCCWCGFDLEGIYPAHVTCPECGAGLKRDRAVRMGVRRRIYSLMVIGAVLALLPLAPLAIALYAATTGVNINEYKPVWLLLFEARGSRPGPSALIAQELLSRMQLKSVDAATGTRIGMVGLDLQEKEKGPWTEDWGDVIEHAYTAKYLSEDDRKRYRQNSVLMTFRARPQVRPGDPLPVEATLAEARCGSSSQMTAQLFSVKATLGGKVISRPNVLPQTGGVLSGMMGLSGISASGQIPVGYWWVFGSKSRMGMNTGSQTAAWEYRLPKDFAPGVHELEVHVTTQIDEQNYGTASSVLAGASRPHSKLFTFKTTVEVLGPAHPKSAPVALSAGDEHLLRMKLNPSNVMGYRMPGAMGGKPRGPTSVQLTFNMTDLPAPIAHRVVIVHNGREQDIGQLASGSASSSDLTNSYFTGMDPQNRMLHAAVPRLDLAKTKTIDIILRPDPAVAARMLDPVAVYTGELVFKAVPLMDQSQMYQRAYSSSSAATEDAEETESESTEGVAPEDAPED